MRQYLDALKTILEKGEWVENPRTGMRCLTKINVDLRYNVSKGSFPMLTTRKVGIRTAIGEILGYIRGYTNIKQFHALGVKSWDANANNPVWLANPNWAEEGDLGLIYGGVANNAPWIEYGRYNTDKLIATTPMGNPFYKIYEKLKNGEDDRRLIWSFWMPNMFKLGCLAPCMYEHQFSLINDKLYLNSTQRSGDMPIGVGSVNMVQCYFILWLMAYLTGKEPMMAYHRIVNAHIYENQIEGVKQQLENKVSRLKPKLVCLRDFTIEDVLDDTRPTALKPSDFKVIYPDGYKHPPAIQFPFTA